MDDHADRTHVVAVPYVGEGYSSLYLLWMTGITKHVELLQQKTSKTDGLMGYLDKKKVRFSCLH